MNCINYQTIRKILFILQNYVVQIEMIENNIQLQSYFEYIWFKLFKQNIKYK